MFAAHHRLANLTVVVDRNNIQINGMTYNVMGLNPLKEKWESFGWHVIEVDGHNIEAFVEAVNQGHAVLDKPTCIIAHTIAGKGIKEIENNYQWHGKPPSTEEEQKFLRELRSLRGSIEAGHMD